MRQETTFRIRAFRQALELATAEQRDEYRNLPRWCELKNFPSGSCDLASNFLARYLMDRETGLYPCIIHMCGDVTFREAENSTVNSHVIVMLDGNYVDLTLDQFDEYPAYVPAEHIESGGELGILLRKIHLYEGKITTRHIEIGTGQGLYHLLSKSADELLAQDPEMLALERESEDFRRTVQELFKFDAVLAHPKGN